MAIGRDIKTGEIYAEEYGSQVRGQMTMEEYQKQQAETTDAVSEKVEERTVVDFRAVKQA